MSLVEHALEKARRAAAGKDAKSSPGSIATLEVNADPEVLQSPDSQPATTRRVLVDRAALRSEGYLPESGNDRLFADFYRQIKRPLISRALGPTASNGLSHRLIMLTSALPGDGKTFTSLNLALSMTRERDISVLLVDGDVAKPHISRILGVNDELGLLDAVSDPKVDVESLVIQTDVEGLSVLPAGRTRGNEELLASAQMSRVAARLLERNPQRIVLFDTPPLLLSSESRALANLAGQVVLVVRSGRTLRQAVLDAVAHVGEGHNLSLVLNQGRMRFTQSSYRYGTYGSEEDNS
jgi:protein-tyrosine kinase